MRLLGCTHLAPITHRPSRQGLHGFMARIPSSPVSIFGSTLAVVLVSKPVGVSNVDRFKATRN